MNISYEKSKLLKDIKTKYPRTNKNRFTRNLLNLLFNLPNPRTPLQMVSEHSNLKSTEEIYRRVRVIELDLTRIRIRFKVKKLPTKTLN